MQSDNQRDAENPQVVRDIGYRAAEHGDKYHFCVDSHRVGGSATSASLSKQREMALYEGKPHVMTISIALPGTRAAYWFAEPLVPTSTATPPPLHRVSRGQACITQVLEALEHPFVSHVSFVTHSLVTLTTAAQQARAGAPKSELHALVVVRPLAPKGSVRDLITSAKARAAFKTKYGTSAAAALGWVGTPLPLRRMKKIGKCVAEAMDFLTNHNSIPCLHVHSGNILVEDDGTARIGDSIENDLMGMHNPLYEAHLAAKFGAGADAAMVAKLQPEVVVFGCLLYEMAVGQPIAAEHVNTCADLPANVAAPVAQLLRRIFRATSRPGAAAEAEANAESIADNAALAEDGKSARQQRLQPIWTLQEVATDALFDDVELFAEWEPQVADFSSDVKKRLRRLVRTPVLERLKPLPARTGSNALRPGTRVASTASPRPSGRGSAATAPSTPSHGSDVAPAPPVKSSRAPPAFTPPPAPPAFTPPPAPPSFTPPAPPTAAPAGRGALLDSIRRGKSLKKASTNDRSQPKV